MLVTSVPVVLKAFELLFSFLFDLKRSMQLQVYSILFLLWKFRCVDFVGFCHQGMLCFVFVCFFFTYNPGVAERLLDSLLVVFLFFFFFFFLSTKQ